MAFDDRRYRYRSHWQAEFSCAWIKAIAAAAGVTCAIAYEDVDGIDVQFGGDDPHGRVRWAKLEAQVKSWTAPVEGDGYLKYRLKLRNYESLRLENTHIPRILVVVVMPASREDWLSMTDDGAVLRRSAYWTSLAGMPPVEYHDKVPIKVPKDRRFSAEALLEMMRRISEKGRL